MSAATTKVIELLGLLIIFAIWDTSVAGTANAQGTQQMNDLADAYMRQAMKRLEREERREQRQEAEVLRRESLPTSASSELPLPFIDQTRLPCLTSNARRLTWAVVTARPTAFERNLLQFGPDPQESWGRAGANSKFPK